MTKAWNCWWLVALLLSAHIVVIDAFDPSQYDFAFEVIPGKYTVHAKVVADTVKLALEVETTGWIGFGISETGAMAGADIVWGSAATNTLVDAFAIGRVAPIADLRQDWVLNAAEVNGGVSVLEIERAMSIDSSEDRSFNANGDTSVIVAYGDATQMMYHGNMRARTSLNFNSGSADVLKKLAEESTNFFEMRNNESNLYINCSNPIACGSEETRACFEEMCVNGVFADARCKEALECKQCYPSSACVGDNGAWVPEVETTYAHHCQDVPANHYGEQIIGFEFLADPETQDKVLLHHFGLDLFTGPGCTGSRSTIWVWGPGLVGYAFPAVGGILLGANEGVSISIESHFNNPMHHANEFDYSGVRFYTTSNLRPHNVGIMQLGDPILQLTSELPVDYSSYTFSCPSSATQNWDQEEITIFSSVLHMHEIGTRMFTNHYRGGVLMSKRHVVDYFDFDFQRMNDVSYTAKRGDSFITTCYYSQTPQRLLNGTKRRFGLGSRDEMCIDFMYYYPKINSVPNYCGHQIFGELTESKALGTNPCSVNREFGSRGLGCQQLDLYSKASPICPPLHFVCGIIGALLSTLLL